MMTPLDIQTKSFSNAPLGYKKTEVDSFTEEVLTNYETLYKSYNEANEKIKALQKEIDTYKGMEDTMKNTLVVAQSSAEQLTSSARKEAEAIVSEANVKSQEIIAKIIAEKTGKSMEEIYEKTRDDTYFNADEAIAYGLATGILGSPNGNNTFLG